MSERNEGTSNIFWAVQWTPNTPSYLGASATGPITLPKFSVPVPDTLIGKYVKRVRVLNYTTWLDGSLSPVTEPQYGGAWEIKTNLGLNQTILSDLSNVYGGPGPGHVGSQRYYDFFVISSLFGEYNSRVVADFVSYPQQWKGINNHLNINMLDITLTLPTYWVINAMTYPTSQCINKLDLEFECYD